MSDSAESEYETPHVRRSGTDVFVVQEKSVILIHEDQAQPLADALSEVADNE